LVIFLLTAVRTSNPTTNLAQPNLTSSQVTSACTI
jgi:hypothetical protein